MIKQLNFSHFSQIFVWGTNFFMGDEIYHGLANVLDTLPNGFPATESCIEIKALISVSTNNLERKQKKFSRLSYHA
jgi:hypothetical protein